MSTFRIAAIVFGIICLFQVFGVSHAIPIASRAASMPLKRILQETGSSIGVRAGCPEESLRRIGMCTKIVRTAVSPLSDPNLPQVIPGLPWSSTLICTKLSKTFPTTVTFDECRQMAGHILGASGNFLLSLVLKTRRADIHDVCVDVLSTEFPVGSKQRFIAAADAPQCSFKATGGVTGVRCLLLHGLSMVYLKYDQDTNPNYHMPFDGWVGAYPKYWGVAQDNLDGLCDVRIHVTETSKRGWDSPDLQKEYCDAIASYDPHVVITHSMGNNIIGAAVFNKIGACARISRTPGAGQIVWYSSQAPWMGTPISDLVATACGAASTFDIGKVFTTDLVQSIKNVALDLGVCKVQPAAVTLATTYKTTGACTFQQARETARTHVSGALCGISGKPMTTADATINGMGQWILSTMKPALKFVQWGKDLTTVPNAPFGGNDGLVPFASCDLGQNTPWSTKPSDPYYVALSMHQAGTCLTFDSPQNSPMMQPCTWFQNRLVDFRKSRGLPIRSVLVNRVQANGVYQPFATYKYTNILLEVNQEATDVDEIELE